MAEQRVERRLAAIFAADVAGYSRLMGADEAGTARRLREHREAVRPIVTEHGGRVVKTTGDGAAVRNRNEFESHSHLALALGISVGSEQAAWD